ncbi:MAG: haloacid dehalogenase type II [Actinomycetota bacterium]
MAGETKPLDVDRFEVLTFDCYGTLIDWETGILAALRAAGPEGWPASDEELLERFAVHEAEAERGEYRPYREVLEGAARGVARDTSVELPDEAARAFGGSVGDWPAFEDSPDALRRLAARYRLGVVTNCDEDLFAESNRRLGVRFDWVITAERVRSYKPNPRHFEVALETIGVSADRILHVAQSLFHDHVPAKRLGLTTAWIDRRTGRPGSGATPLAKAEPDATYPTLAAFADAALGGGTMPPPGEEES